MRELGRASLLVVTVVWRWYVPRVTPKTIDLAAMKGYQGPIAWGP